MLAHLVIIPIGDGPRPGAALAHVLKLIETSGLPYQVRPGSTSIEGTWDQIMAVAKRCHDAVHADFPHLLTILRLEEDTSATHELAENLPAKDGARQAGEPEQVPALSDSMAA
jgi:uncharacterized protein (TIGR00106 family)